MKLHSPQFEKAVQRAIKDAIQSSPELQREARAAAKFRKKSKTSPLIRVVFSTLFGLVVWALADYTKHPVTGVAVVNLWAFITISYQAQQLLAFLCPTPDLAVLSWLPTPKTTIFRWELQKFYRGALMSLFDLLAGFGAVAISVHSTAAVAAVIPAAVLTWFTMLACSMLCAGRFPRFPYPLISAAFFALIVILYFCRNLFGLTALALLDHYAPTLNVLMPTGWAASVFLFLTGHYDWTAALLLVPIGALLSTTPGSLARLRNGYKFTEAIHPEASDLLPHETDDELSDHILDYADGKPLRVDPASMEETIQKRLFSLTPVWHDRGWFENLLWRWLKRREKVLSEFAFPNGVSIWPAWKKIFRNLAITVALTLAAGYAGSTSQLWLLAIGMFITVSRAIAQLHSTGAAFRPIRGGAMNTPLYAGFAIGFRELSGLLLKYSAVQVPLLILLTLSSSAFIAYVLKYPVLAGLIIGFKTAGLIIALRFIFLALAFNSGTHDCLGFNLRTLAILTLFLGCASSFLTLAAMGFLVAESPIAWAVWALALIDACAFWFLYGCFYSRARFDLMTIPRR
jgi:hypothetical protein